MIDLTEIKDPSFVKTLSKKELEGLAIQIREFLIENLSKTGGHLSSNLGIVELTIAMYYVFDSEKDHFLFDVGHQSYVHKILTGRAKEFSTLRQYGGLSGYIRKEESKYDVWESGHSSTSISAMAGMLLSDPSSSGRYIALIGDSSITNGVAFEGLNFLGSHKELNPIILLNDNKMGITKTVGVFSKTLSRLRGNKIWLGFKRCLNAIFPTFITNKFHQIKKALKALIQRDNIFEDMGFDYYGPIKGNSVSSCIKALKRLQKTKGPVLLHILTKKGKGYAPAEQDESGNFHGVGPFDIPTGKPLKTPAENEHSYSEVLSFYLDQKRRQTEFVVVTPAMKAGAKLEEFAEHYPNDFFDVGIAEEHAAVMSAGMALKGKKVVLLYYSTFAQRAYDEILNDICRQKLPVIIGIDRAGVVGEDGETHQGIYDISMFSAMPFVQIAMPKDAKELIGMFNYAFHLTVPIVIRYPRQDTLVALKHLDLNAEIQPTWEWICEGKDLCVLTYGPEVSYIENWIKKHRLSLGLVNARWIRPLDEALLIKILNRYPRVLIVEEVVSKGTLYDEVLEFCSRNHLKNQIDSLSFSPNVLLPHGSIVDVLEHYGFSERDFLEKVSQSDRKGSDHE